MLKLMNSEEEDTCVTYYWIGWNELFICQNELVVAAIFSAVRF